MRKPLIILLSLLSLLSQWAWMEHAYHDHDAGEVCEICLIGQAQSHAAIASTFQLPSALPEQFEPPRQTLQIQQQSREQQNIRAPPPVSTSHS